MSQTKKIKAGIDEESQWFGNERIDPADKKAKVAGVFDSVALKYDLMNDVMSLGIHRLWKKRLIETIAPYPQSKILDVASGTGDIGFALKKFCPDILLTLTDINPNMLEKAKDKAVDLGFIDGVEFKIEDAEALSFKDGSFDYYNISFGLRNVTRIDLALKEAYRVLRPGGFFTCLEFSPLDEGVFQKIYDYYSFHILPQAGKIIAKDEGSYRYLAESIRKFPDRFRLKERIEKAGFDMVSFESFSGGIAVLHKGYKV